MSDYYESPDPFGGSLEKNGAATISHDGNFKHTKYPGGESLCVCDSPACDCGTRSTSKQSSARQALEAFKRNLQKSNSPMTRAELTEYMRLKDAAEGRTSKTFQQEKNYDGNVDLSDCGF